jgi:23S rRNA pseudouridine1911/1915/1917 synthase
MGRLTEEVPAPLAGERVDRFVAMLTGLTRAEVASLIGAGAVAIGEQTVSTRSRRLQTGDVVMVDMPEDVVEEGLVADPSVVFDVVHADYAVVVVDKPPGLVVHPGAGHQEATLVHGLLARFPDLGETVPGGDASRPGIVHRLDQGTSGLLVVARTQPAWELLVEQLKVRAVERRYLALVWGTVEADSGLVDAPLGRSGADPTRMAVVADGREARTGYEVLRRLKEPSATLLECRLETGRTHQIRVHLAAIGHPVVGDPTYRAPAAGRARKRDRHGLYAARPFLHAHRLAFDHPATGQRVSFESPLPADLAGVIEAAEGQAPDGDATAPGGS